MIEEQTTVIHPTVWESQKEWLEKRAKSKKEKLSVVIRELINEAMEAERQAIESVQVN